jgi:hypothetical protein
VSKQLYNTSRISINTIEIPQDLALSTCQLTLVVTSSPSRTLIASSACGTRLDFAGSAPTPPKSSARINAFRMEPLNCQSELRILVEDPILCPRSSATRFQVEACPLRPHLRKKSLGRVYIDDQDEVLQQISHQASVPFTLLYHHIYSSYLESTQTPWLAKRAAN